MSGQRLFDPYSGNEIIEKAQVKDELKTQIKEDVQRNELKSYINPAINIPESIFLQVGQRKIQINFPEEGSDLEDVIDYINLIRSLNLLESNPNIIA